MHRCLVVGMLAASAAAANPDLPMPPPPAPASPAASPSPSDAVKPRMLVSDLAAQGVSPEDAAALTDAVVSTLEERGMFQVMSRKDVEAAISAERARQLLGQCAEEGSKCGSELSSLGARFLLSGSVSKLGTVYQLSLQVLDTLKAQRIGRSSRLANSLVTLRLELPYAVAEAAGTPLPPPPSRLLQYSLIASGAAAVVGGGFLGVFALGRQAALNDELCPGGPAGGACTGTNLRPRDYYQEQDRILSVQKTTSLALLVAGVAAAGAGLWLMPPPDLGPRIALLPTASGVALVGVLP